MLALHVARRAAHTYATRGVRFQRGLTTGTGFQGTEGAANTADGAMDLTTGDTDNKETHPISTRVKNLEQVRFATMNLSGYSDYYGADSEQYQRNYDGYQRKSG